MIMSLVLVTELLALLAALLLVLPAIRRLRPITRTSTIAAKLSNGVLSTTFKRRRMPNTMLLNDLSRLALFE